MKNWWTKRTKKLEEKQCHGPWISTWDRTAHWWWLQIVFGCRCVVVARKGGIFESVVANVKTMSASSNLRSYVPRRPRCRAQIVPAKHRELSCVVTFLNVVEVLRQSVFVCFRYGVLVLCLLCLAVCLVGLEYGASKEKVALLKLVVGLRVETVIWQQSTALVWPLYK